MDEPIYYVCKYTPIELLSGFGLRAERLDPAPVSFECADGCAHPNLCGYGKAILEETLGRGIRRLLLVDCCDVCRRVYDVLLARGGMDFLLLLSLPHQNGPAERALLAGELRRLQAALERLTGDNVDRQEVSRAWRKAAKAQEQVEGGPYIALTGAHGGALLLCLLCQRAALPVRDLTCTGIRTLPGPEEETADFLTAYAAALLGQERPCMRMQFRPPTETAGAVGVVCHTVKFCDYYGFEYRALKARKEPLLKIETDCTPQSGGQLRTRIEAFMEMLGEGERKMDPKSDRGQYVAGVDSGSSSTDAVILNRRGEIVGSAILPTGAGAAAGAEKALEAALRNAGLTADQLGAVVTTGYGREAIGGQRSVTEITCHAKGAHHLAPEARTVIDIGGQDSKVIRLDENGQVINFVMNDKCAAGTGRFLEMMARTMELSLDEMSELGLRWQRDMQISSMCTVFAESEVVSLIAANTASSDIVHGLNESVAAKTVSLVRRAGGEPAYVMTGGVARNRGVVQAIEKKLSAAVRVPEEAQLCGALGAALIALEGI